MEEVRQLVQEEGREARNLVAFHVSVDSPARARKPPRCAPLAPRRAAPRPARLRSASAGRDKRSELRARYWALLFGDLQRSVGEIYNTVEAHENLNECQEVILVLENYTRDFKALGEWFRLKWEYDNTPPPQRPQSLAWEIRKTDFVRPESRRAHSVRSSPSVSGKNSPCLSGHNTPSGKNSPSLTGKASPGSGKVSPRISSGHPNTSPKGNVEFFSSKIASKIATKPEARVAKESTRLSDIKEKDLKESVDDNDTEINSDIPTFKEPIATEPDVKIPDNMDPENNISELKKDDKDQVMLVLEIGKAKESLNVTPKPVIIKSPLKSPANDKKQTTAERISSQAKDINDKMNEMETEFLTKQIIVNSVKNDNMINKDQEIANNEKAAQNNTVKEEEKTSNITDSPTKSEDNFADISNESSPQSTTNAENIEKKEVYILKNTLKGDIIEKLDKPIINGQNIDAITDSNKKDHEFKKPDSKIVPEVKPTRPAYSQAAAKPKPVTPKTDAKTPTKITTATALIRSKTVIEMRPANNSPKPQRPFPKRNQTSKCSYPFNLTTGRKSLFDTTPNTSNKIVPKKPVRNTQLASGDTKTPTKVDVKKRAPRPTSLKIDDKKEPNNPALEKIRDNKDYSSSDTIVTQIDMDRIDSSDSLKTLVPDDMLAMQDVAGSIEVLNLDNKNDNEGWLTVKSRRLSRESKKQSKSHWANRFNQPSATTSLPTLNMIESPKQDVKPVIEKDRAKSEQPQSPEKAEKVVKVAPKIEEKAKDPAMIRQKSDVTGLRTRSKKLKKEKLKHTDEGSELTKNRLHSSLESLTGLLKYEENPGEVFDFDKWKSEFKSSFKYLDDDESSLNNETEILKSADPSEASEIAEMTSQIEENEKKICWALDFQSTLDQMKLTEEENHLNRQIMELQEVSDIEIDTETEDAETETEILCEETAHVEPTALATPDQLGSLEEQYESALAGMTWAERMDTLVVLEELVARDPGRAQQLHAKLSQGIKRRGSFQDALRRLQAKQARAERQRMEYQTERAKKIHGLLARVEEVKSAKLQLLDEKRIRMERRLQRAAFNRDLHLKGIVRKAHDEEEKLREIAFIKQLQAENKRQEFLQQFHALTTRLKDKRRERLGKLEQKAAREEAVASRRHALEQARKLHVESLVEKRRERDARAEELKEQKKQEKEDAAREKAEGVKSRLSALAAAAELEADALRSRIRDKQDASQQRLESHLQAIREKATGPRQATISESQEPTAKDIEEEELKIEQEKKEREKQKAVKKRARKIKQKLLATGEEFVFDTASSLEQLLYPASSRLHKVLSQLHNAIIPLFLADAPARPGSPACDDDKQTINKKNKRNKTEHGDDAEVKSKKNKAKNKIQNGDARDVECKSELIENGFHDNDDKNKQSKENSPKLTNSDDMENKKTNKNKKSEDSEKTSNEIENNNNTEEVKEKKKRKSKTERRLSKSNSVCSSLSDTSRASGRTEKRSQCSVDLQLVEKHLNEMCRIVEKMDMGDIISMLEKTGTKLRVYMTHVLGQILYVAAERRELASFTTKSVTNAVTLMSRFVSCCSACAKRVLLGSLLVHLASLLCDQLEKDLHLDPREMELAKQTCDCLAVSLDSVLCFSKLYQQASGKKEMSELERGNLINMRKRAHHLISYICLSGCLARTEVVGGVAREGIQALLTVCADLCNPCDVDVTSDRVTAMQALKCALGTSIVGSRSEFCMLFAEGAELKKCSEFVRAARTVHLLKALAEMDHQILQECFGEGGWPLEFRAAIARLLSQHAPTDNEEPKSATERAQESHRLDLSLAETMVLDLISLIGFVLVNNPQLQETILSGWSVIPTLLALPACWLVLTQHARVLLPTLCVLRQHPLADTQLRSRLNAQMVEDFINNPENQEVKLIKVIQQGRSKKSGKKVNKEN